MDIRLLDAARDDLRLADAFERVLQASERIGVRGIVVHAASADDRNFYLHIGFDPSPIDPDTLLIRLSDVAVSSAVPVPGDDLRRGWAQRCGRRVAWEAA